MQKDTFQGFRRLVAGECLAKSRHWHNESFLKVKLSLLHSVLFLNGENLVKTVYSICRMVAPVAIFLTLSLQYRGAVIIMYVGSVWVPLLIIFLSTESSRPSVLRPLCRPHRSTSMTHTAHGLEGTFTHHAGVNNSANTTVSR